LVGVAGVAVWGTRVGLVFLIAVLTALVACWSPIFLGFAHSPPPFVAFREDGSRNPVRYSLLPAARAGEQLDVSRT
jgi:hypothetical protein